MNFFDTYEDDGTCQSLQAAEAYIQMGFPVIPLKPGEKKFTDNINKLSSIRQNPINLHNISFFFQNKEDIAIILDDKTEVIDIDEKNMRGITAKFDDGLKQQNPDLYDKLVQVSTKTGGRHYYYRCHIVGGEQRLASRLANPQPEVIIEKISHPKYIKCPPSTGYKFIHGTPDDIQYITPEERMWLIHFARSFNQVIKFQKVKQHEQRRKDSPFTVFNERNNWEYILRELKDSGWKVVMELDNRIHVKRPGDSEAKSSGSILKDSNTLFLFSTSTEFPADQHISAFQVYAQKYHDGNILNASRMLSENGTGKMNYDEGDYWIRNGTSFEIKYDELRDYLHDIGFRRHEDQYLVQVINNIVHIVTETEMHRLLINEVEQDVKNKFYTKVKSIFEEGNGLYSMLDPLDDNFIRDDRNNTWLFFKNCAVNISREGILKTEYVDIPGYIWASHIMQHDFNTDDFEGCDTEKFVNILGGDDAHRLRCIIGYMISDFKDTVNPRCVLITEDIDVEEEGESHGGSGKSLLIEFVKQIKKTCQIDGKNFNAQNPFVWQNVNPDTSLVYIDDVSKGFKLERLYSIITGTWQINKKYKEEVNIPFKKSPKLVLTSNYAIGTSDDSTRRRIHNFPVVKRFNADYTPYDMFNRAFFLDWDEQEWNRYYNYMCHCAMEYLLSDRKLSAGNTRYNERALINETNTDFVQYMDSLMAVNFHTWIQETDIKTLRYTDSDGKLVTNGIDMAKYDPQKHFAAVEKNVFITTLRDKLSNPKLTMNQISVWLKAWAKQRGATLDTRFRKGRDQKMYYRVVQWQVPDLEVCTTQSLYNMAETEESEDDLPF